MNSTRKLLRPLHRQRVRKAAKFKVYAGAELCELLAVSPDALEACLTARALPCHKDSQGELWVSLPTVLDPHSLLTEPPGPQPRTRSPE